MILEGFLTAIIGYLFIAGGIFCGRKYVQSKQAQAPEKTAE